MPPFDPALIVRPHRSDVHPTMDVEELKKKLRALEVGQTELKREVSKLRSTEGDQQLASSLPRSGPPLRSSSRRQRVGLSQRHHKLILQSLGEAVHILDLQGNILFWYGSLRLFDLVAPCKFFFYFFTKS